MVNVADAFSVKQRDPTMVSLTMLLGIRAISILARCCRVREQGANGGMKISQVFFARSFKWFSVSHIQICWQTRIDLA